MTTSAGDNSVSLRDSLASLFGQSSPPEQLVIVVDGPIDDNQDRVLRDFAGDGRITDVRVIRLDRNVGRVGALNAGIPHCSGEWVMRLDSDNICRPDRVALQRHYLEAHPETDVLSAWCSEFDEISGRRFLKSSPVDHDNIAAVLRWRNVLVHPATVVRRSRLLEVDGYRAEYSRMEDYDLYVRLVLAGAHFHALPKALLDVRKNKAAYTHLGGFGYVRSELRFRLFCYRAGFLSLSQFAFLVTAMIVFRMLGHRLRAALYPLVRVPAPDVS
ncbi:glycosyltransferase [Acidiphilium sp. 20-67-58]|nr:glycosyltransferase [Acidiphilium sp. 20-67-58]